MYSLTFYKRTVYVQFILALFFITALLNSTTLAADLHVVKYMNEDLGFTAGKQGYLAKTTDGGLTWNEISTGLTEDIFDICIIGEEIIIAGCTNGKIMKTTDGGLTWESKINGVTVNIESVYQTYDNLLLACGDNSLLVFSYDQGETWETYQLSVNVNLNKIHFYNWQFGYIACSNSTMLITDDGGQTWSAKVLNQNRANLNSIDMADDKIGTAVGDNGRIYHTWNGWMTWKNYSAPSGSLNIFDIKYFNENEAIASGQNFIVKSTNKGRDWFYTSIPSLNSDSKLNSICIAGESKGIIVGSYGTKLLTTDNGATWGLIGGTKTEHRGSLSENKNYSIELSQNYPNPFNPSTIISYTMPENGTVSLKVYDISGKEVASLVNEYKPSGSYNVSFNASALSTGVYFYTMTSLINGETNVKTMRMLLIK